MPITRRALSSSPPIAIRSIPSRDSITSSRACGQNCGCVERRARRSKLFGLLVSIFAVLLVASSAQAKHIWAMWELDLGGHAPPTHFVLTVTSPTGAGGPPPMTVPWAPCTHLPDVPADSYCAPIGCPPTGTYIFVVQAHYEDGLSDPSNAFTCTIPSPSSMCDCTQGTPKPSTPPPAPSPPPTIAMPAFPEPPPGMISQPPAGMTAEAPPLPQHDAQGLPLQPLGDYPPIPVIPDPLGSLI